MSRFIGKYIAIKVPEGHYIALIKVKSIGGDPVYLKLIGEYDIIYPPNLQDTKSKDWIDS